MDLLTPRALASPARLALLEGKRTLTYYDLWVWASALEATFSRVGITAGSRVAALLPKEAVAVAAIHALARMGAIFVPLNLRLAPAEMRSQLARSGATHIVATEATAPRAREVAGERAVIVLKSEFEIAKSNGQSEESTLPSASSPNSRSLKPPLSPAHLSSRPQAPEEVALLFTSGTTGRPKAALLTANNFIWSAIASAFRLGVLPEDRWLLTLPLYHVGGLSILFRSALYGTTVVLPHRAGPFDPHWLYEVMEKQHITLVSLVPTMLYRLLETGLQPPPSALRLVLLGGAAAPPDLLRHAIAQGYPVATTYGLTEAASQVATATPAQVRHKPGSVGKPLLYTQVRVVGENGRDLPAGEIGEIVVQGPTVFNGYDGDPQATAAALRHGWLHTGDLGYLDAEGDLWVVNRRSDLVVTGGENVYPAEVEAVLRQHPAVAEVCIAGVDDAEWGQRPAAAVVLKAGANASPAELESFCRQHLAGYKVPRCWRFVEALPRTASGKIMRPAVRAMLAERKP